MILGTDAIGQSGTGVHPTTPATVDSKNLDRGQLDGVNYSNNFFGLSLSVPQTWVVVSAQRNETIAGESSKLVTGDQKKKEEIDESIQRSVVLLSLTKLPAGEPNNRIGGADFGVATVKNSSPNGTFMQKIYVTTKDGYALELFYTYQNDADLAALNSIVGTMKIK